MMKWTIIAVYKKSIAVQFLYPGESEFHLLLQDLETWCEGGKMLKNLESDEREDWDEGLETGSQEY